MVYVTYVSALSSAPTSKAVGEPTETSALVENTLCLVNYRAISSVGRAALLHSEGHRFKPCIAHTQHHSVTEHPIYTRMVGGSSPSARTMTHKDNWELSEWSIIAMR